MTLETSKQKLFDKYYRLIFKAIKDLNCYYKTEDEFQEYVDYGVIGLLTAINNYDKNKNAKTTYFYTCIRNTIIVAFTRKDTDKRKINYLEKQSLDELTIDNKKYEEILADESINIEEEIIKKEEIEILYKAINMLKPTYKDIICKNYGIGCHKESEEKIAAEQKVSKQAVNEKKKVALKQLKKYILEIGGENE